MKRFISLRQAMGKKLENFAIQEDRLILVFRESYACITFLTEMPDAGNTDTEPLNLERFEDAVLAERLGITTSEEN